MASTSSNVETPGSDSQSEKYQNVINICKIIASSLAGFGVGAAAVGVPGYLIIKQQEAKHAKKINQITNQLNAIENLILNCLAKIAVCDDAIEDAEEKIKKASRELAQLQKAIKEYETAIKSEMTFIEKNALDVALDTPSKLQGLISETLSGDFQHESFTSEKTARVPRTVQTQPQQDEGGFFNKSNALIAAAGAASITAAGYITGKVWNSEEKESKTSSDGPSVCSQKRKEKTGFVSGVAGGAIATAGCVALKLHNNSRKHDEQRRLLEQAKANSRARLANLIKLESEKKLKARQTQVAEAALKDKVARTEEEKAKKAAKLAKAEQQSHAALFSYKKSKEEKSEIPKSSKSDKAACQDDECPKKKATRRRRRPARRNIGACGI